MARNGLRCNNCKSTEDVLYREQFNGIALCYMCEYYLERDPEIFKKLGKIPLDPWGK